MRQGVHPYDPWVQNPNVQLDVQVDRQPIHVVMDGMWRTMPSGRTRIIIEGSDERVLPYWEAVTELVKKEPT